MIKPSHVIGSLFGFCLLHVLARQSMCVNPKTKTSWKQVQLTSHLWNTLNPKIQRLDLHKYGSLRLKASRFSPTCIRITLSWRDDSFEQDEKQYIDISIQKDYHIFLYSKVKEYQNTIDLFDEAINPSEVYDKMLHMLNYLVDSHKKS